MSVQSQIQTILRADAAVLLALAHPDDATVADAAERVLTRPLKRAGMLGEDQLSGDPTPEAFEDVVPHWVKPTVVIGKASPAAGPGSARRYQTVTTTLAYYAAPDVADVVLLQLREACAAALRGRVVEVPGGMLARIEPTNVGLTGVVAIPEFPGAGDVLLERVPALGVWRRS